MAIQSVLKLAAISVPVAGAVPTGITMYEAYEHGIAYSEVSHSLEQQTFWNRNGRCVDKMVEMYAPGGMVVEAGVCEKTGDMLIQITRPNGDRKYQWFALGDPQNTGSAFNLITTPAFAENEPVNTSPPNSRIAQAKIEVVCEGREDTSKIVRIVKDATRCYMDKIDPVKGTAEKRQEVSCDTPCPQTPPPS